jgi:hypothetical protein
VPVSQAAAQAIAQDAVAALPAREQARAR